MTDQQTDSQAASKQFSKVLDKHYAAVQTDTRLGYCDNDNDKCIALERKSKKFWHDFWAEERKFCEMLGWRSGRAIKEGATMTDKKLILCLDFDGVLHSYTSPWQNTTYIPDPPVPGAMQFLWDATELFHVHVFSTRSVEHEGRMAMKSWVDHQFKQDKDLSRRDHVVGLAKLASMSYPKHKPPAFLTIDDRVLRFDGAWPDVRSLLEFKPWNKRGDHAVGFSPKL